MNSNFHVKNRRLKENIINGLEIYFEADELCNFTYIKRGKESDGYISDLKCSYFHKHGGEKEDLSMLKGVELNS